MEPAPVIEKGAMIGWHALIIGGVTIGENATIAAGATITKKCRKKCQNIFRFLKSMYAKFQSQAFLPESSEVFMQPGQQ